MSRTRNHLAATAALLVCTVGALPACGEDTATTATDPPDAPVTSAAVDPASHDHADGNDADGTVEHAEYCTAYTDITMAMGGQPDPEAITANVAVLRENAPADLQDQTTVMSDAVEQFLASNGEDYGVLESAEFVAARGEVDPFVFENCEFDSTHEVAGRDFAFDGIPDALTGGRVAMLFTNEGAEAHEIAVVRRNDGVTESFEELLALPEEEAMAKVTYVGAAFAPAPGSSGLLVGDLEPGDYVAICFVPVGTTATDGVMTPGTGEPHFAHGMQQEFTVTG